MKSFSLKSKLMLAFCVLLIGSGTIITLSITDRLSRYLQESLIAQGEHLCHSLTLEGGNGGFIEDSGALRRLMSHQQRITPSLAYMMIIKKDRVLAHTFSGSLPAELLQTNAIQLTEKNVPHKIKRIITDQGKSYLDFELPVLPGHAETLRMGLLEKPYRHRMLKLWIQMGSFIGGILLLVLVVSFLLIRRITRPLSTLAEAAEKLNQRDPDFSEEPVRRDEVGRLMIAINHMGRRIGEYTQRLEENTRELERAHLQIKKSFEIIKKIGEQSSLAEVCKYLYLKIQEIVPCKKLIFYVFDSNRENLFTFCNGEIRTFKKEDFPKTLPLLGRLEGVTFIKKIALDTGLVSADMQAAARVTAFPIHCENQFVGALLAPCPGNCKCDRQNREIVDLVLDHASRAIQRAMFREEERRNIQTLRDDTIEYCGIVGRDPKMQAIYKLIEDIAPTDTTVLIQGESGTGKELAAQAIHQKSLRADKPFVVINCPAYPSTLLESELFGHEKGAFTGAVRQKKGRFEQAHAGTVFLDEIGELPATAQIKLLRILQTQKFERVGGEKTLSVDVRIIAATNKDLLEEVRRGNFREDLYYRLNVIPLHLPPLKDRRNDIPLQARYFLKCFAGEQGKEITGFGAETMRRLLLYHWPGNVRELENCIEHAVVLAKGNRIEVADLPTALLQPANGEDERPGTIEANEVKLLQEALQNSNWNKKQTAARLGISRNTLYRKIRKYQISQPALN